MKNVFANTDVKLWGREISALARKSASAQLEEASGGAHFLVRETNWSKWGNLQNCPSNNSTHIQVGAEWEVQLDCFLQENTSHITNQYFYCRWVAFNFIILKSVVSNRGPLCFLLKSICWFNTRTCIYSMMINHMPDQVWSSCIFAQKWISTRDRAKRCSSKSSGIG